MQTIQETIKNVIKELEKKQEGKTAHVEKLLKKCLTRSECSHIKLISLKKDIAVINVDSSAWLYQLNQKKEQLIEKSKIKDLIFRLGEIK